MPGAGAHATIPSGAAKSHKGRSHKRVCRKTTRHKHRRRTCKRRHHRTPPALRPLSFVSTTLKRAGGEPAVSISPSGRVVLVDGLDGESPATLYRSIDYGRTFTKLS